MPGASGGPLARIAGNDLDELDASDKAARRECVGQPAVETHLPEGLEPVGIYVPTGVDEETATMCRSPRPVLDVLVALHDRPGPRLCDGQRARFIHVAIGTQPEQAARSRMASRTIPTWWALEVPLPMVSPVALWSGLRNRPRPGMELRRPGNHGSGGYR